jgi:hypothetical protein
MLVFLFFVKSIPVFKSGAAFLASLISLKQQHQDLLPTLN